MIEFQRVHKTYSLAHCHIEALKGVDGYVESGEVVALCGPSGAGKSSLLNICSLLNHNYKGRVIIDGGAITKTSEFAIDIRREKMGFIFPDFNLVAFYTVFENVEFPLILNNVPRKERLVRVKEMLCRLEIEQFAHNKPELLDIEIKQRATIARAFINRPVAVMADEPMDCLERNKALNLMMLVKQLGREFGTAVLLATNDSQIATRCDRTIHLQDGFIVEHVPLALLQQHRLDLKH